MVLYSICFIVLLVIFVTIVLRLSFKDDNQTSINIIDSFKRQDYSATITELIEFDKRNRNNKGVNKYELS